VIYEIPYRELQIMMKDKLHEVSGGTEVMKEVSDSELFGTK
jgi:hypothetical protein